MNFTEESIGAAQSALEKLRENYRQLVKTRDAGIDDDNFSAAGFTEEMKDGSLQLHPQMEAALDDDFNTAAALRELLSFSGLAAYYAQSRSAALASKVLDQLTYWATVLGLEPNAQWLTVKAIALPADFLERLQGELRGEVPLSGATAGEAIEQSIAARNAARARKDFAASDRLRDALIASGVALKDSKEGTTWTVAG
ncbi:MAG: hypothetical protein NVS1B14_12820 [Vulcanimicrobiaceae bacterium]